MSGEGMNRNGIATFGVRITISRPLISSWNTCRFVSLIISSTRFSEVALDQVRRGFGAKFPAQSVELTEFGKQGTKCRNPHPNQDPYYNHLQQDPLEASINRRDPRPLYSWIPPCQKRCRSLRRRAHPAPHPRMSSRNYLEV